MIYQSGWLTQKRSNKWTGYKIQQNSEAAKLIDWSCPLPQSPPNYPIQTTEELKIEHTFISSPPAQVLREETQTVPGEIAKEVNRQTVETHKIRNIPKRKLRQGTDHAKKKRKRTLWKIYYRKQKKTQSTIALYYQENLRKCGLFKMRY